MKKIISVLCSLVLVSVVAFAQNNDKKGQRDPEKWREKWLHSVPEAVFCVALLLLCLAAIAGDTYNPFIDFQF